MVASGFTGTAFAKSMPCAFRPLIYDWDVMKIEPETTPIVDLSPQDRGLVTGAFAIAYALFEIPSGYLVS